MTRLLLDTDAFLRYLHLADTTRLDRATEILMEGSETLLLSAISFFEVNQKVRVGKLNTAMHDEESIEKLRMYGIDLLPLTPAVMARAAALDWRYRGRDHRDPFDRMIAATALVGDLTIVSSDAAFDALGIRRLWT